MARTETIKDVNYRIIGYLEHQSNGDIVVKDSSFRILGYYRSSSDTTLNVNYQILYHGNMAAALLAIRV